MVKYHHCPKESKGKCRHSKTAILKHPYCTKHQTVCLCPKEHRHLLTEEPKYCRHETDSKQETEGMGINEPSQAMVGAGNNANHVNATNGEGAEGPREKQGADQEKRRKVNDCDSGSDSDQPAAKNIERKRGESKASKKEKHGRKP